MFTRTPNSAISWLAMRPSWCDGGLGGAIGAEFRSRHEDVLGGNQNDVAASSLHAEVARRFTQQQERSLGIHALDALECCQVHLLERAKPWRRRR